MIGNRGIADRAEEDRVGTAQPVEPVLGHHPAMGAVISRAPGERLDSSRKPARRESVEHAEPGGMTSGRCRRRGSPRSCSGAKLSAARCAGAGAACPGPADEGARLVMDHAPAPVFLHEHVAGDKIAGGQLLFADHHGAIVIEIGLVVVTGGAGRRRIGEDVAPAPHHRLAPVKGAQPGWTHRTCAIRAHSAFIAG